MQYNEFAKMCDLDSSKNVTGTDRPSTGANYLSLSEKVNSINTNNLNKKARQAKTLRSRSSAA